MLRHLPRYTRGLDLALREDRLARGDLARLTPYLPNLGTAWMSAAAMTARDAGPPPAAGASGAEVEVEAAGGAGAGGATGVEVSSELAELAEPPYTLVNDLLEGNFKVMADLPRAQALVFFRDVTKTMWKRYRRPEASADSPSSTPHLQQIKLGPPPASASLGPNWQIYSGRPDVPALSST